MKKTVVIGVSSGIAAFKSLDLVRNLKDSGINVQVIMTKHATHMLPPSEFEKVTGEKVLTELFAKDFDYTKILASRTVDHIQIADSADLLVIAPATANTIAKIASGMADDFLTTTILATTAQIIICPSMNVHMWQNPITQENIQKLKKLGYIIIEPDSGMLACGYTGQGRLADITKIQDEITRLLDKTESMNGKRVLVTAGGTVEKIDNIRSITNRSSGKMGIALAEECVLRGAEVLLLKSKSATPTRYHLKEEVFTTADELETLIKKHIKDSDILIHAAAVSDFTVANNQTGKIPSNQETTLHLTPRAKILDTIKNLHPNIFLIAFKAEYNLTEEQLIEKATKRLTESRADAIIANDVSQENSGFESDTNEVIILLPNKQPLKLPHATKKDIAKQTIDYLENFF